MITKQFKHTFQIPITCILLEDVEDFYNTHHSMTRFFHFHNADDFIDNCYRNERVTDFCPESWSGFINWGIEIEDGVNFSNDLNYDSCVLIEGPKEDDGFSILLEAPHVWINFIANITITAPEKILNQIDDNFRLNTTSNNDFELKHFDMIADIASELEDNHFQDDRFHVFHKFNDKKHAIEYAKELQKEIQSKGEFIINLNYENYE